MNPISMATGGSKSVVELVANFGPAIVIISMFLILFIIVVFYIMRQQQKSNESIMREHQLLIQTLIKSNTKTDIIIEEEIKEKKKHDIKETIDIFLKVSSHIKVELSSYMNILKSDRLAIYLLHNGQQAANGFPFFKFSCISEQVKHLNMARIKSHHDFPVNLMSDLIQTLFDHKTISFYDEDSQINIDPFVYKLLVNTSNKYIIKGIFDTNVNLIGFILVEFDFVELNKDCYFKMSKEIDNLIKTISPILEFSNVNNIYQGGVIK